MLCRIYKQNKLYVYEEIELIDIRKMIKYDYDSNVDVYFINRYEVECNNLVSDENHGIKFTTHAEHYGTIKTMNKEEVEQQYYNTYDDTLNAFMKKESETLFVYNNIDNYINKIQNVMLSYTISSKFKDPLKNYGL